MILTMKVQFIRNLYFNITGIQEIIFNWYLLKI
jgi:hypothetical protein